MSYIKSLLLSIVMFSLIHPKIIYAASENQTELFQWPVPKGEIIDWQTANKVIPLGSRFQIIDVDTGLTFKVQRRAGSTHADVQPLTRSDTNIMKMIYKGKWSWNRNDIVIKVKDKYLAASMNGMPHGHGALRNGFPGHFCIHFKGSTTHKRNNVDLAHHLMIASAAAKLDEFVNTLSPTEIVQAYEIGINHKERTIINHILASDELAPLEKFKYMRMDISDVDEDEQDLYIKEIQAKARVQTIRSDKLERININFVLIRESVLNQWRIAEVTY